MTGSRKLAPDARVERDAIYVQSGKLYTSAGVTSGMDMALALVEADWGKASALAVAQELVMYLKRPGGQSQFSRFLSAERRDDVFGNLELWMLEHLDADLSVESLARRVDMSPRHFARLFVQRIGDDSGGIHPPAARRACPRSHRERCQARKTGGARMRLRRRAEVCDGLFARFSGSPSRTIDYAFPDDGRRQCLSAAIRVGANPLVPIQRQKSCASRGRPRTRSWR